ncbi:MAG: tetratricopeptide repeat protein [Fimbriimonadaceae bacterium]|jgi:tetratricopeptide (TPR) repeat protein|nr:tetratricopeptide repeat protein [Fimbriimonadaceae bacterium]
MSFVGKWFGFGRSVLFDEGVRAYERGDFESALECFRNSCDQESDPGIRERSKSYLAGSLGKLAKQALESGDSESAIRFLKDALDSRPRFADLRLLLAKAYHSADEPDAALKAVEEALRLNPRYGMALVFKGCILYQTQDDKEDGLSLIELGMQFDHRLERSSFELGKDRHQAGKTYEAAELFLQIKPVPQADAMVPANQADLLMKKNRFREAEELYRQALDLAPHYPDLHLKYGQALMELNEVNQAAHEFREAATLNPNYTEAYALLGIALRRMGDDESARDAFRKALDLDPHHPIAKEEILFRRS